MIMKTVEGRTGKKYPTNPTPTHVSPAKR
jgi:hypothetical protein